MYLSAVFREPNSERYLVRYNLLHFIEEKSDSLTELSQGTYTREKECVDTIHDIVYEQLKPLGFHKHSKTLHHFVAGDISQVIILE